MGKFDIKLHYNALKENKIEIDRDVNIFALMCCVVFTWSCVLTPICVFAAHFPHKHTKNVFCLKMIMTKIIYLLAHYYTKGYLLSQTHKAVFRNRIEKSVSLIIKTSKVQEDGRPF